MSRLMKRFVSLMLVLTMMLSMASMPVYAEEEHDHSSETVITVPETEVSVSDPVIEVVSEPAPQTEEQPVAEEPTEELAVEEPVVEQLVAEEPAEEPAAEEPVAEEPAVEEPAEEPAVEESAVEETVTETPAEEPAAEEPAVEETPAEEPVEEPVEEPTEESPADEPAVEEPVEEPAEETPAEEPVTEEPVEEPSEEIPAEEPVDEPVEEPAVTPEEDQTADVGAEPSVDVPENTEEQVEEEKEEKVVLSPIEQFMALIDHIMLKYVGSALRIEKPDMPEEAIFIVVTEELDEDQVYEILIAMDEELWEELNEDLEKLEEAKQPLTEKQVENLSKFYHNFGSFVKAMNRINGVVEEEDKVEDIPSENAEDIKEETTENTEEAKEETPESIEGEVVVEEVPEATEEEVKEETPETTEGEVEEEIIVSTETEAEEIPVSTEGEVEEEVSASTETEAEEIPVSTEGGVEEESKGTLEITESETIEENRVANTPSNLPTDEIVVEDTDDSMRVMLEETVDYIMWEYFILDAASSYEEAYEISLTMTEEQIIEAVNAMDEYTFESVASDTEMVVEACEALSQEDAALVLERGVFEYVCAAVEARANAEAADATPVEPVEEEVITLESLRAEIAEYIAYYGMTTDMPDSVLLQVYSNQPSPEAAEESLAKLDVFEQKAMLLSGEEQGILLAEENTYLCIRYRDVVAKAYDVAVLADPIEGITFSKSGSGTLTQQNNTVTATVKGSNGNGCTTGASSATMEITVKNDSGEDGTVSFDMEQTNVYYIAIDGGSIKGQPSLSRPLPAGESFKIVITTDMNETQNKLVISNIAFTSASDAYNVTVTYPSGLGSVSHTVEGVTPDVGEDGFAVLTFSDVSAANGVKLTAISDTFLCWTDMDNKFLSAQKEYTVYPSSDVKIKAVMTDGYAYFLVDGTLVCDDLNTAMDWTKNGIVVLMNNGTLPAGDYAITKGVTLLIPFDDANTVYKDSPNIGNGYSSPVAYRTLTMASGANIIVNGALSLSAKHSYSQRNNGSPTGNVSFISMQDGSTITVNNGGNLYAWGYIVGSGSVTIESGATVYEYFQVTDYRGGSATTGLTGFGGMLNNSQRVFPFNQYYVQNIEVPMTLKAGASEKGYMSISNGLGNEAGGSVPFIGTGGMFLITDGYIVKDYMEGTGRLLIEVYGSLSVSSISVSAGVSSINSANYTLPITSNMTVDVLSGTIDLNQEVAFFPGAELYIAKGATCNLADSKILYVYDWDEWGDYCGHTNETYIALSYVPGGNGTVGREKDAQIRIEGTVNLASGDAYVTKSGANVYSKETGIISVKVNASPNENTYQATQASSDISYTPINIKPLQLKNADGQYLSTAYQTKLEDQYLLKKNDAGTNTMEPVVLAATKYTFVYENGKWILACDDTNHYYAENGRLEPTCAADGHIDYACQCGNAEYVQIPLKATGQHTEVEIPAVEPTCVDDGFTAGKKCSVCDVIFEKPVAIPFSSKYCKKEVTSRTEATCTEKGVINYWCSVCELPQTEDIPALGHSYNSVVTEPTCTEDGFITYTCTACGDSYTDPTDALGHSYSGEVTKPTCTEQGYTTYTCTNGCGDTYKDDYISATGHNDVDIEAVEATCTTAGSKDGKKCSVCGVTTTEPTVVPATGHAAKEPVEENKVDSTCSKEGSYDEVVYCSVCRAEMSRETKTIEKKQHTPSDAVREKEVDASCLVDGSYDEVVYCSVCNAEMSRDEKTIPATGHTNGDTVKEKEVAATCTTAGSYDNVIYCTVCDGEVSRKTVTVEALGHKAGEVVVENNKAADCDTDGSYDEVVYCSVCGAEMSRDEKTIPATGHTNGDTVKEKEVAATCTTAGSYDNVIYCTVCDGEVSRKTVTVDALGHKAGEVVVENNEAADCENDGSYDNVTYCTVCEEELTRNTVTVGKLGHTKGEEQVENNVEPTCTKGGSYDKVVRCTVCNKALSTETVTVDKLGHTKGEIQKENNVDPTCTVDGSYDNVTYCTVCKVELSRNKVNVDKLGHTNGAAVVENKVDATCTNAGSYDNVVYCTVCNAEVSRDNVTVDKLAHSYNKVVTAPTCGKEGYTTYTCSACGDTYTGDEVAALEHVYGEVTIENKTDPTCTVNGSHDEVKVCSLCGDVSRTTVTDKAPGHTEGAEVAENNVVPTCTVGGSYDKVIYCTVCKAELSRTNVTVPQTGHKAGEAQRENVVKGSCTVDATHDEVTYCINANCGIELSRKTVTDTEAPGHKFGEKVERVIEAATCTTDGSKYTADKCSVCSEEYNVVENAVIPRTGHDYTVTVFEPTCTEKGYTLNDCNNCDYSYTTNEQEANGHTWSEKFTYVSEVKATCTTPGSITFAIKCTVPGCTVTSEEMTDVVEATGHTPGSVVVENEKAATCYAEGSYEAVTYCTVCGDETSRTPKPLDKILHTPGEVVVENNVAPTCYQKGSYDNVTYCTVDECGEEVSRVNVEVDTIDHTPGEAVRENEVAVSCFTNGSYERVVYCSVEECHEELSRETITTVTAPNEHTDVRDVIDNSIAPTCTSNGSYDMVVKCFACSAEISRTTVPVDAIDHTWDETKTVINNDSDCTNVGSKTVYCKNCDHSETQEIAAKGHTEGAASVEDQVDSTCYEEGSYYEVVRCSVCKVELDRSEQKIIAKLAHNYDADGARVEVVAPDCEKEGYTRHYCLNYDLCESYKDDTWVAETGHTPGTPVRENEKAPSCLTDGSYEAVISCQICQKEISRTTMAVPAPGHTAGEVKIENNIAPTCTVDGSYDTVKYCTVEGCGAEVSRETTTVPQTGHTAGEEKIENNVDPTCTVDGSYDTVVYCTAEGCGAEISRETTTVPAVCTPADPVVEEETKVSCFTDGQYDSVVYCSVCKKELSRETIIVPAPNEHDYDHVEETPATCTTPGLSANSKCKVCGDVKDAVVIPARGHSYERNEGGVVQSRTEATCTVDGKEVIKCNDCEKTKTTVLTAPGHDFENGSLVEHADKTCEEDGYDIIKCAACDEEQTNVIKCTGHLDVVTLERKEPDCSNTGLEEGSYCNACKSTIVEQKEIPATGHTDGQPVQENIKNATCSEAGSYDSVVYCSVCGDEQSRETITVDATGNHTPGAAATCSNPQVCTVCGTTLNAALGHDKKTEVTDATCEEAGLRVTTCSRCDLRTEEPIDALRHNYTILVETIEPTCTEKGYSIYQCVRCDSTTNRDYVDALNHTGGEAVKENTVNADCENAGSYDEVIYCSVCDAEMSRTKKNIDALGHTNGTPVTENSKTASCTVDGSYDTVIYCTVCTKEVSRETTVVPKSGHKEKEPVVENKVEATCAKAGSYDEVVYCDNCGEELDRVEKTIEVLAHTESAAKIENEVPALCYKEGSYDEVVYCSVCGHEMSRETKTTPKTGKHVPGTGKLEVEIEATCYKKGSGYRVFMCANDGCTEVARRVKVEIDMSKHTYVEGGVVTTEPTCENTGIRTFKCTVEQCGYSYTETIPELNHNYSETVVTAPTCTEGGYTTHICKNDPSHTYDDTYVPATGHTKMPAVVENNVDATCTTPGSYDNVVYCSVCNEEVSRTKTTVNALGHTPTEAVKENEEAPKCDEDGSYDMVVYCSVCDAELSSQHYVVDQTGHTESEAIKEKDVQPNCTTDGSYDMVVYCSVCGDELSRDTTTVPKLGHTKGEPIVENDVDATCTTDGSYDTVIYCSVCDEELSRVETVVPQNGHTNEEAIVENEEAATCSKEGSYDTVIYCAVCDAEVSRVSTVVPKIPHTNGEAIVENNVDATCTTDGSYDTVVYCTVCKEEVSRDTTVVSKLGHTNDEAVVENEVAATCTSDGKYDSVIYCAVCDAVISRKTITVSKLGHTKGEVVVENEVAATCTKDGSYDNVTYCTVCEIELSRKTITVTKLGHTKGEVVVENEVAATCTTEGSYDNATYCTVCKIELSRENVTVDALGHTNDEAVVENEVAATCTTEGSYDEVTYCTVCGDEVTRKTITTPATDHNYVGKQTKAPTCYEFGETTYVCENDSKHTYTESVDKLPHTEAEAIIENNVDPTCTEAGSYDMVVYCSVEACRSEINRETIVVAKKGHTEGEAVEENRVEATCKTAGSYESAVYCTVCDEEISRETKIIDKLKHTPAEAVKENEVKVECLKDGSYDMVVRCSVCGEELERNKTIVSHEGHKYVAVVTEPTCLEKGYTTNTCSVCGDSYTNNTTVATGHKYGEPVVTKPATCLEKGISTATCENGCGATRTADIPATGHSYEAVVTDPTCTEQGFTTNTCAGCGDSYKDKYVNSLGHTIVVDEAVAPTCTKTGLTEGKHCSVCEIVLTAQTVLNELGHTEVTDVAVEPTCTKVGYTEGKHCSVCNEVLLAQEEIDALGHDEVTDEAKKETCTEDGLTVGYHCLRCGEATLEQKVIPATGHNIVVDAAVIPNDCVTPGLSEGQHCNVCSAVLVPQVETPAGHLFIVENGVITLEPTCTILGEVIVTCEREGCGATEKRELSFKHQEIVLEAVAPTCTKTGLTEGKKCELCDAITVKQEIVNALGHTEEVVPGYAETCDTDGMTDGLKCTACGETLKEQEVVKARHSYEEGKAPCTAADIPLTCTRCGFVLEEAIKHEMAPATCTMPATCIYGCGYREGNSLGHDWTGVTCAYADTCRNCGLVSGEPLPHTIKDVDAKNATYTNIGWTAHQICTECDYKNGYVEIPKLDTPVMDSYEKFITALPHLEQYAYEYVLANPGKDPVALVIKYIRTGVERYNSGSWEIMAGLEDKGFAEYVATEEDKDNSKVESEDEMIKASGLKYIKNFNLPNGNRVDFGHMFGTMDITYHNKTSLNHADVGGWAGDLVDLLTTANRHNVHEMGLTLEEMVTEIGTKHLLISHAGESDQFSQTDMYGDLDAYYVMQNLDAANYKTGDMTKLMSDYFSNVIAEADEADEYRAAFLLNNRLGGVTLRNDIRTAVFNAYTGNKMIATLEGTREEIDATGDALTNLRIATCYAFADYLCRLAGDYVDTTVNPYLTVRETSTVTLAPGVTQTINKATSADGKQMVYYIATADITRSDVNVYANYNENDPSLGWAMARVIDQANAAQERHSDPNSEHYVKNYNVVVSTNADGYNMTTGEPGGLLVMGGVEHHEIGGAGFFGILENGRAVIGSTAEYNSVYKDQVMEGVGGFGVTLVKNGEIVVTETSDYYASRASRTAVGITKTGKVVLMVLDGRQEPWSCGGSMIEIAQIMKDAGCDHAINLDGGGSTTFVSKLPGTEELQVTNRPSDGYSRSVSTSLMIVSTAPSSTAFDHAIIESDVAYLTVGTTIQMSATAVSETGNKVNMPDGTSWAVSDSEWGLITPEGAFTALKTGEGTVNLMQGDKIIGSKTIYVVVPDSLYFTSDKVDVVYGNSVKLPLKAYYVAKEVAINSGDIAFTLSDTTVGEMQGFYFVTSTEKNIKTIQITAALAENQKVKDTISVLLYKHGENSFDFDKATGGNRELAWYRQVSNSVQEDERTYRIEKVGEDMVTNYTIALDMTQIQIPEKLDDLTYMLPGADVEGASAWTFLLQLAQRISVMSNVTAEIHFDKNFDIDVSEINLINDYFELDKDQIEIDREENILRVTMYWIKQTQPIDAATANPLCIVNGIKLIPKAEAAWDKNNSVTPVNTGSIRYTIGMRASSLYSFALNPENQAAFGLYPYTNPNDSSDKGGQFSDTYATFNDSYTLINIVKNGWVIEDGGYAYYVDGTRFYGIKEVEGLLYDFGENGVNVGKTPFTGLFFDDENRVYRYSELGELQTGWVVVNGSWHYFDNYAAVSGQRVVSGVEYTFEENGRMAHGVWIETANGFRYYNGPTYIQKNWALIDGEWYCFKDGYRLTGYQCVGSQSEIYQDVKWRIFDENGVYKGDMGTGFVIMNGKEYALIDGVHYPGLHKIDEDYYCYLENGGLAKGDPYLYYYAWQTNCDLPCSNYYFGPDGKMLDGLVRHEDGIYYYNKGKIFTPAGITRIGDYYYFVSSKGRCAVGTYNCWATNCEIPVGTYTFDSEGRMINPPLVGWIEIDAGYAYYKDGQRLTGIHQIDGYYYGFDENGVNVNKTKYTGEYTDKSGSKFYIEEGLIVDCLTKHTVEIIPAKAPTCTEPGLTDGEKCTVCNKVVKKQEEVAAPGHDEGSWVVKTEATSEAEGLRELQCTVCGTVLETEVIPKLDRLPGDVNEDGDVDVTDLLVLARYLAELTSNVNLANADVDASNEVDITDLLILARYLAEIPGVVLK